MRGTSFKTIGKVLLLSAVVPSLMGCASMSPETIEPLPPLSAGDKYVAMGSSFAAGPGVTRSADQPTNRCARSNDNYARQLAKALSLKVIDVSCSGATTAHILGDWNELPPQIDALSRDTKLVTVTIGGNDVSLVRNLIAFGCQSVPAESETPPDPRCPTVKIPSEKDWQSMEAGLNAIASTVKLRSPDARLAFVQYVPLVPESGECAALPFSLDEMSAARKIAKRLASVTARVAKRTGAFIINGASDGRAHDPCSNEPWATGFPGPNETGLVPFHPNLAGMSAIASALQKELRHER